MPNHLCRSKGGLAAIMLTGALFAVPQPTLAQQTRLVAGTLTCNGRGNVGLILGSRQVLDCVFTPSATSVRQNYTGRITRLGLDIGIKGPSVIIWSVLASTNSLPRGALAGRFAGVSANAAAGIGAGANVLLGGSHNSIVLQPLSVQAQTGLNVAAGIAGLRLTTRH
jgi:hypothetical protein